MTGDSILSFQSAEMMELGTVIHIVCMIKFQPVLIKSFRQLFQ